MDTSMGPSILVPDQFYKELEEGVSTKAEKVALHQERRSELGKQLGLDVGPPNEAAMMADAVVRPVRDWLGLPIDPMLYAKKKCNTCYGRGVLTVIEHISLARRAQLIEQDAKNEMFIEEHQPGKYQAKFVRECVCSNNNRAKVQQRFVDALLKEDLAKKVGESLDSRGRPANRYVLL